MIYFLDTSALVKRYRQEEGTQIIDALFSEKANTIIISSISICEFVRAIDRHFQSKELGLEDFSKIIESFYRDLHNQSLEIVEVTRERLYEANRLILTHHLSANDAIILASCLLVQETDAIFVCADVRSGLLRAAQSCRLSTLNPLSS